VGAYCFAKITCRSSPKRCEGARRNSEKRFFTPRCFVARCHRGRTSESSCGRSRGNFLSGGGERRAFCRGDVNLGKPKLDIASSLKKKECTLKMAEEGGGPREASRWKYKRQGLGEVGSLCPRTPLGKRTERETQRTKLRRGGYTRRQGSWCRREVISDEEPMYTWKNNRQCLIPER